MSTSLLPTRSAQRALTLFLVALITLAAGEAWACAACACGDPTLTTLGADQPFEGRLRAGTLVRAWGYSDGVSHGDYGEVRMDLAAAYSPLSWLTLSAQLPLQVRGGLAGTPGHSYGVGDVTVSGRALLYRDRPISSRWLVSAVVGSVLPTSATRGTPGHEGPHSPLSLGEGAFSPLAGASVLTVHGPWSGYLSVTGALPLGDGAPPPALRTTLFAQHQVLPLLALRVGAEARLDAPVGEAAPHGHGTPDLDFRGPASELLGQGMVVHPAHAVPGAELEPTLLSFASLDALFSLTTDSQLQLGLRWPLVTLGAERPWPIVQAGFAADF